jgi:hypothetical protein
MYKFLSILILFLSYNALWAQLSGNLDGDTLRADLSPYHVVGNVHVIDLIIEPGVTILFDDDYDFETDGGLLKAVGFYNDSIIFKPDINNHNGWTGLFFKDCIVPSELKYCRIDGSNDNGVKIDDGLAPNISNTKIINNDGDGFDINKVRIQFSNCIIKDNGNNGVFFDDARITIQNSIITGNINAGILSNDNKDSLSIVNTVIADNIGTGLLSAASGYVNVINSIIYYNGIEISTNSGITDITYSNIRRTPVYPGIGNINGHPWFKNTSKYIYTLTPNQSPCIDAGDSSSSYNDIYFPPSLGSNLNDMGAYGGPLAGEWYPPLYIQPDSLNFGKVSYDSTITLSLSVKNYRDSSIIADSIYFIGSDSALFSSDTDYLNINVLDSSYLNISFTPDRQDFFSATLILQSQIYGKLFVPITGQGVVSEINYVKNQLDFETVALGDTSVLDFPIINTGDDTLKIFQIYTSNTKFTASASFININPNPSRDTLFVTFIPDSIDMLTDSLIMITNDPDEGRVAIPLFGQGVGPIIDVNNETIDFGSVYLTRDSVWTIAINNNGNDSLYISDIQVLKNDTISTSFRLLNDTLIYPIVIDSFGTYNLDVLFEPNLLDTDSALLVIQHNDVFKPEVIIDLIGSGIAAVIELDQSAVEFGLIPFYTFALDTIMISNSGNYNLNINPDSLMFKGNYPQLFIVDSISTYQIAANDSAYLYIKFFAGEEGVKLDTLQILSNDLSNPKVFIAVSGESRLPQITFSDTLFNFGDVLKDSVKFLPIVIYNNGLGELLIFEDSLNISGSDSNYFEVDSISKYAINYLDSAFLRIKFIAEKVGLNEAYLNLVSNDPNQSPKTFNLSGIVLSPSIEPSQTTFDFGSIPLFTKKSEILKIYNQGDDPIKIFYDSLKITGLDSQFFSIDSIISDSTIQPIDSAQIVLSFTSSDSGDRSAKLTIFSDDQLLPEITVDLFGNCIAPYIDLSHTSFDFGRVPVGSDSSFMLKIYNKGLGKLILYKEGFVVRGTDSSLFIIDALDSNVFLNSMESFEVEIVFNASDTTGPKSAYLHIPCNDYDNQNVNLSGIAIDNAPASIVLDQNHSSQELVLHQNGNLRFFISANSFPDSVILYYQQGGSNQYYSHNLTDLGQLDMWEVAIDSSWITAKGFEYFVRVYHGERETDFANPNEPKSLQVMINFIQYPEATQNEVYQKISIPFHTSNQTLNELFADDLGGYDNTKYRFFDCENGSSYAEITNLDKSLPPGKSLWLITKNEVKLDFANAKTLRTDTTFQLSLHSGWNMIATPFDFPINWNDNDSNHQLRYYYDSDWPFDSIMVPYKGYAVEVNSDTVVFLKPEEYSSNINLLKQSAFEKYNWTINLKIEQGKIRDYFNFAGSKDNASDGIDKYDYSEPPPIGNFVALYFTQKNEITGKIKKFSTDINSEHLDGYIYDFEVSGNVAGKKDLIIEPNSLPKEFQYIVVNPQTKIKYQSDVIELFKSENRLQLLVGSEEFINSHTTDYNFVPTTFNLQQNYPNPFNPSTVIKYQIPGYTKVTMDIYNILGQRVKSLLTNAEKDAGYYLINWDGTNNSGNTVASGIYFLNFRTKQFSKSIKMLLQR